MKIRSSGVVRLKFNGKSISTSLFTYDLQKDTQEQLLEKLRDKINDFFVFYSKLKNQSPIKHFEAISGDFSCRNGCNLNVMTTKVSVIRVLYTVEEIQAMLSEEAAKFGVDLEVKIKSES
jgi:hypothetical protein